jgi:hypothetical protein
MLVGCGTGDPPRGGEDRNFSVGVCGIGVV